MITFEDKTEPIENLLTMFNGTLFQRAISEIYEKTPKIVITDYNVETWKSNGKRSIFSSPNLKTAKTMLDIPSLWQSSEKKGKHPQKSHSLHSFFDADGIETRRNSWEKIKSSYSFSNFRRNKQLSKSDEDVTEEIYNCIQTKRCKKLPMLLTQNKSKIQDFSRSYFVHEAAYNSCVKCIFNLLRAGFRYDERDDSGWTVLHAAVLGNNHKFVKSLLQKLKNNANAQTDDGLTPLHLAIYMKNVEAVKVLINFGADPIIEHENQTTPFQLAIKLKRTEITDYFVQLDVFLCK